jgi:hypothetical protein
MDPSKFDDLTKAMATSTSRRKALKTIAATTLGGILGLGGIGTAFAKPTCKPNGHGCGNSKQCCSGFCDPTTTTCGCPTGQTNCSGTCIDLSSDNHNCGSCGNVCPAGQMCSSGQCVCPPGTTKLCNGTCAHTCGNCPGGCGCVRDNDDVSFWCAGNGSGTPCSSDCDCLIGEFCVSGSPTGFCTGAC